MGRLSETLRKSIHLSSLVIPLGYRYTLEYNRRIAFAMLLAALVVSLVIEFNRFWQRSFRKTFHRLFGMILRRHELKDFTGATYLLVSSLLCVAFFDERIAAASIAFLSIGDTFAALIGMNFGKRKFLRNNKSLEGSLACFVTCAVFGLWWLANPWLAIIGALTATAAELSSVPLDDNIKIPLSSALVMTVVSLFI
ncbi:MAG: SEC59/DGK1/VTE5 family protein [Candidatus Cloacimonetes bacterium]|jgi:dolichol kinase|nr:SEC59/DGK1/VTE5 family protein [Candidatus Cloacimonadota bacterium]MDD2506227.1 SEC59/DGK1/VTE5 family protein [Candidatus Cloacimonadota bacterium]MDD4147131.1 SEC59/DGK1/VTE5 family protein [Candidatus Cloacimonadota bacterium]MDD4559628.1 SEC59/DGK1/VTE5 family protein [Candidatus Cloacimonadota bacterium]